MNNEQRTAESNVLTGEDDPINGPAKRFLQRVIERRLGIKPQLPKIEPPKPSCTQIVDNSNRGTDCTPPVESVCARAQSDPSCNQVAIGCNPSAPGVPQDGLGVEPAKAKVSGQPAKPGATERLFGEPGQPRNIGDIKPLPPKPSEAPVTVRDGKAVGRPFDLSSDDHIPDTTKMVREPGEDE